MIHLLAEALPPGVLPTPWSYIAQYGPAALLAACLVLRKFIVPAWTLDSAEQRITQLTDERDVERTARNDIEVLVREKYVPALEASRTSGEALLKYLQATGVGEKHDAAAD